MTTPRHLLPLALALAVQLACDSRADAELAGPIPEDTLPSVGEAASFAAAVAAAMTTVPDHASVQAITLAGGLGAGGAILPPAEENSCGDPTMSDAVPIGVVLTWDPAADAYRGDLDDSAPECGYRLVYYELNPSTGEPADPLTAEGLIDVVQLVRDPVDPVTTVLQVTIVATSSAEPDTFASYATLQSEDYHSAGVSSISQIEGIVASADSRLAFWDRDRDDAGSPTSDLRVSTFDSGSGRIRFEHWHSSWSDGSAWGASVSVLGADRSLEIELNRKVEWITGQRYDDPWAGHVYARGAFPDTGAVALVSGSDEDPVFTRLDGEPLAEADVANLQTVWNAARARFGTERLPR